MTTGSNYGHHHRRYKGKNVGLLGPRSTEEGPVEMEPRLLRKAGQLLGARGSKEGQ